MLESNAFIGMMVIGLASLVGLFFMVYNPLNKNTEAMTELTVKLSFYMQKLDEHISKFEEYKKHVSDGQKEQWDAIRKNKAGIVEVKQRVKAIEEMEDA